MSLDIDQIALHQLVKRDEQTLDVVLRDTLLPTNAAVEEMMTELHRVYSAKSKALKPVQRRQRAGGSAAHLPQGR